MGLYVIDLLIGVVTMNTGCLHHIFFVALNPCCSFNAGARILHERET
jgi:hypothetical protein